MKYKYKLSKSLTAILTICLFFILLSCDNSLDGSSYEQKSQLELKTSESSANNEYSFLNKKFVNDEGIPNWEAQIKKIIENDNLFNAGGLEITGYKFIEEIKNVNQLRLIKSEIVIDHKLIPMLDKASESYKIVKKDFSEEEYAFFLNQILPESSASESSVNENSNNSLIAKMACPFNKNSMGLVNIEWKYNGENLNTICIVSDKGIIFDEFIHFLVFSVKSEDCTENKIVRKTPRLKASTAEVTNKSVSKYFYISDRDYNFAGSIIWEYEITIGISGIQDGTTKDVKSKYLHASGSGLFPYSCSAQAQSKNFVTGSRGYLDAAWAFNHRLGLAVTISWNGSGFTFSGGGTSESGEEYITASEME